MLQLRCDLDFVQELLVSRVRILLRYLQRDPPLLDRVVSAVNVSERTGGDTAQDPVFSDFLSGS